MTVKLGLVGTGTVGGGCLDILSAHRDDFKRLNGIDVELVRVCSRNSETAAAHGVEDLFTTDFNDVINDPEVDIVIELIGGTTAAYDLVMGALRAGKNVVTANKALMATHGSEILELAREKGLEVAFEASVGGGIPIIGPLTHGLHANGVSSVLGIVNGTTNYMLTRMSETGATYDDALAEAQEKGFAEADPTADVDGFDAAAKIAILSTIAFNTPVNLDDVYTEGIRNIMPTDLAAAKEMGYCVKLLAIGNRTDAGIDVRVHPTMVPLSHPLATVNGVFNAIYVVGDAVGETMFFGEGAGAGAAASAVMGDVLEVARHVQQGCTNQVIPGNDGLSLVPMEELTTRYYIRFVVEDRRGVLASTARVFSDHDVSVYSVIQRGSNENVSGVDLVYITHTAQERDIRAAIQDIRALDGVLVSGQEPTVIRVQK
ncbi:homoserine dehydrogenase [Denitrobacterium detoxificans]|uniref:Homoserine dehydrogenase n=1 Tax=Denitrobacterium detoxificans TaxID=79604 RepID=A0A1H8QQE6_9ACTN|nr:homoserine dehydrogenase [Denitrobacterium detoxificans]SEO56211.1 homoserine dehydrogenase [Denitrobacterium detoxificans]